MWTTRYKIPKIIWTYWHTDELPEVVQKCIDSWKKHCPDHEIRVLHEKDTTKYRHSDDFVQRHADFVRLDKLYEHGGIWMDASVFLNQSLDWVHDDPRDFIGYKFDRNSRSGRDYVENWFMAAPKGSKLISDWRNEFQRYNNYDTVDDYLKHEMKGVDLGDVIDTNYYLAYAVVQKCMQKYGPYDVKLVQADSDGFKHLEDVGWDYKKAADNFCDGKYKDTKMTKLTKGERDQVLENSCRIINESVGSG